MLARCKACVNIISAETKRRNRAKHVKDRPVKSEFDFKTCSLCGESKPTTEYRYNSATSSGLHSQCRVCERGKNKDVPVLKNGLIDMKNKYELEVISSDNYLWTPSVQLSKLLGFYDVSAMNIDCELSKDAVDLERKVMTHKEAIIAVTSLDFGVPKVIANSPASPEVIEGVKSWLNKHTEQPVVSIKHLVPMCEVSTPKQLDLTKPEEKAMSNKLNLKSIISEFKLAVELLDLMNVKGTKDRNEYAIKLVELSTGFSLGSIIEKKDSFFDVSKFDTKVNID